MVAELTGCEALQRGRCPAGARLDARCVRMPEAASDRRDGADHGDLARRSTVPQGSVSVPLLPRRRPARATTAAPIRLVPDRPAPAGRRSALARLGRWKDLGQLLFSTYGVDGHRRSRSSAILAVVPATVRIRFARWQERSCDSGPHATRGTTERAACRVGPAPARLQTGRTTAISRDQAQPAASRGRLVQVASRLDGASIRTRSIRRRTARIARRSPCEIPRRNHAPRPQLPACGPVARGRGDLRRRPVPAPGPGRPPGRPLRRKLGRRLPAPRGQRRPRHGTGRHKLERIWNFAENSEEALRHGGHDCSVGFINTWAHDVIIPQGGVQEGSLRANAGRFSTAVHAAGLPAGQDGQSQVLGPPRDRAQAVRPGAHGPVTSRSARWSDGISKSSTTSRGSGSTSCPTRSIVAPAGRSRSPARCAAASATGWAWSRATWSACSSATTSRSRACKPLIAALGARQRRNPSGPADPPARLRRRRAAPYLAPGEPSWASQDLVHFLGFYPDVRDMLLVERLLRPADLLRPLLAGRPRSPGVRPARDHDRAERRRRADDRRPRRVTS